MNKIARDFISEEKRDFNFKIGNTLASALSGFVAGTLASILVFMVAYNLFLK